MRALLVLSAVALCTVSACRDTSKPTRAVQIIEALSADDLQGRRSGTEGAEQARVIISDHLEELGLEITRQGFGFDNPRTEEIEDIPSTNLIVTIPGSDVKDGPLLVVTAHYDHLGVHDGKIFNGADDNASGVGALMAIVENFTTSAPTHDVMGVFLDAEEFGMQGADVLVISDLLVNRPLFNLNLDMVSQNADGVIFASGTRHNPEVKPIIEALKLPQGVEIKFGHDDPADPPNDWTFQSDHRAFHEIGVPYIYFGVEDHPHYHKASDEFSTIPLERYVAFVDMLVGVAETLDDNLEDLAAMPKEAPQDSP